MRQAFSQRERVEQALLRRKFRDRCAELGQLVLELAHNGTLSEAIDNPELQALIEELSHLEGEIGPTETPTPARRPPQRKGNSRRVWRPPVDEAASESPTPDPRPNRRRSRRSSAGGGIAFVDDGNAGQDAEDSDLHEFMHEDDVK